MTINPIINNNKIIIERIINKTLLDYMESQNRLLIISDNNKLHDRHVVEIMNIVTKNIEKSYYNREIQFIIEDEYNYLLKDLKRLVGNAILNEWNLSIDLNIRI